MTTATPIDEVLEELNGRLDLPAVGARLQQQIQAEEAARQKFYDDLRDGDKHEFINGETVMASPVRNGHNQVMRKLVVALDHHLGSTGASRGEMAFDSVMIRLPRNDYHPDVCYWPPAVAATITPETTIHPVPTWIAEILSPSTADRDRGVKFRDYAANGVEEYLIVDPDARLIEQYVSHDRQPYELRRKLDAGTFDSVAIPGLTLDLATIFAA